MKRSTKAWWLTGALLVFGAACNSSSPDDACGVGPEGCSGAPTDDGNGRDDACTAPVTDPQTGLVACQEGYSHRPTSKVCGEVAADGSSRLPRAKEAAPVFCSTSDEGLGGAANGSECDAFEHGYCKHFAADGAGGSFSVCRSGCATDAECGAGFVCICDEPESPTGGKCTPSDCATDLDCGAGLLCASYEGNGCNPNGFACQRAKDECLASQDCAEGTCNWRSSEQRHFCDEARCEN